MRTECGGTIEILVECARSGLRPSGAPGAHLLVCESCTERWEAEVALTAQLGELRSAFGSRRSPWVRRSELLKKFDAQHPKRNRRPLWSLAAAAALLFALGSGISLRYHGGKSAITGGPEISEAQSEMQEAGFIAVPFIPPLAPGELVHMVHTQLHPAALASMGVNVDPTLSADLPADVLVGADGFPRAVRVSEESVYEGGD